jgi:hypothetical protein
MLPLDKETTAKILVESQTFRDWVAGQITQQPEKFFKKVLLIAKVNDYKKIPTIKAIRYHFQPLPLEADVRKAFPSIVFTTWENGYDVFGLADAKQIAEIFIK